MKRRDYGVLGALFSTCLALSCSNLEPDAEASSLKPQALTHASSVMVVVAHEDDDLLFMSPDLLGDVRARVNLTTVYVTAGDAAAGRDYWLGREAGARAAYASMAGVRNTWSESRLNVAGYDIPVFTLASRPSIRLAFLRLPDGCGGEGCAVVGQSIEYLWRDESSVATVDGAATYTRNALIDVLRGWLEITGATLLRIQNHLDPAGDHADHHTAALFAYEAREQLASPPDVVAYLGYPSADLPANVSSGDLGAKQRAFGAYARFDPYVNNNGDWRQGITPAYQTWLARQYTAEQAGSPIRVQGLDKCLDVRGPSADNGTVVQIWDCVGVTNQNFSFSGTGELRGYANKCLDVRGPSSDDGTDVQIWDCVGVANQQWQLTDDGHIQGFAGKCLRVRRASDGTLDFANGTPVEMWECQAAPEQRWLL